MPIPALDADGLLPVGIHTCDLQEIKISFGGFTDSSRRPDLFQRLVKYVADVRSAGIAESIVINGSFVTAKPDSNDIDLILVLKSAHDFDADLNATAYNVISKRRVNRQFGFDLLVARSLSPEFARWIEFFQQVRLEPGRQKGILQMPL
jgi:hypothetical protein